MLCTCSSEQFKFEDAPQSLESLATRNFSTSGLLSRTGDCESKREDVQVDEVESTLKETLSLIYEDAKCDVSAFSGLTTGSNFIENKIVGGTWAF
ncbi:hypothetical protein CRYUN_Cryun07bG0077000 [Craigia yunnanensis]